MPRPAGPCPASIPAARNAPRIAAMVRLRLLLAWLLLAALPLQGFAAATMLFCGQAPRVLTAVAPANHGGHDDQASHADHRRAAGHDDATAHATDDGPPGHAPHVADAGHGCNLCAAACHAVGIASEPAALAFSPAPQVPQAEPFQRFASRPAPVPDKPPRA